MEKRNHFFLDGQSKGDILMVITVPKNLRECLGERGSEEFVELLNQFGEASNYQIMESSAEKFERRLTEEISSLRQDMTEGFAELRQEMNERFASVDARFASIDTRFACIDTKFAALEGTMNTRIAETKSDIIKWMFIFWIGQITVFSGILFAIIKFTIN